MKRSIFIILSFFIFLGCSNIFRDELNELHSEIDEIRELLDQVNGNIDALQKIVNALQINDYVTGVTPIIENGVEIGYTIAFSQSGIATIYHGKDGYTPMIGIRQDNDDLFYWTLDGEWLLDENGKKIRANGLDGEDGTPGQTGADGETGITPQLKIEDGYWYVSYDNGKSWVMLDKATGEDGKDGDPMFSAIDCSDPDFIILTLQDGQTIKLPTWGAFEALQEECKKANANIVALQTIIEALQDNDYVTSITPIYDGVEEIGYAISFSKSGNITIYHGATGQEGATGHTPVIGVRKDTDGMYYWTVDGEWLLDSNGKKVRANGIDGQDGAPGQDGNPGQDGAPGQDGDPGQNGITPQLKIEEGYWYVSYDNGTSWTKLNKATGEDGQDGDSVFKDIILADGEITFVTADGTEFKVARDIRVKIHLDIPENETGVLPGSEIIISYTLENASEKTFVTASSNGVYSVRVEAETIDKGKVYVKAPFKYADGYINIMVTDGETYSFIRVVNFYEEKMLFSKGLEYYISPKGGQVKIPFSTNFDYEFKVDNSCKSWIDIASVQTKSEMTDGELVINVSANNLDNVRTGKIIVIPTNSAGDIYTEIMINQASAFFSIEQSKYAVHVDGETITTKVSSSRGLSVTVPSEASGWLSCTAEDLGNDNHRLTATVRPNETLSVRSAIVKLYSADRSKLIGQVEYVQSSSVEDELSNMVLTVRANIANDYTAWFKIKGKCDCYVDWGDGQAERVQITSSATQDVKHQYSVTEPTSYEVKIYGTMPYFSIGKPCIQEVIQWGQTELKEISFSGDNILKKLCPDEYSSLKNLTSISFDGCMNLQYIPARLFSSCKNIKSFAYTFRDCHTITEIPESLFAECPNVTSFSYTFSDCKSLTDIPEKLFAACPKVTSFSYTFSGCESLTKIPEGLFAKCADVTTFSDTFARCDALNIVPEKLFACCPEVTTFNSTFFHCDALKEVPVGIFDNNRKILSFNDTFLGCKLQGESPYTTIDGNKVHLYERYLYPDHFVTPTSYSRCFNAKSISNLEDKDKIKEYGWSE